MNIVDSSLWLEYFSGILRNKFIYEAEIYTQDKHFENLEQVHYFKKIIEI
jgi:hypothetical protein